MRVDGKEHLRNPKWALLQTHQEVASALLSIEPNRQDHSQARLAGFGRDLNLSVVPMYDDVVSNMQSQARACAGTLRGKEGFENALPDFRGDSRPVVGDLDDYRAVFGVVRSSSSPLPCTASIALSMMLVHTWLSSDP